MTTGIALNDRRQDYEKRVAVMEAVALHNRGLLKEGMRLLLDRAVRTSVIIRTLLNDEELGNNSN